MRFAVLLACVVVSSVAYSQEVIVAPRRSTVVVSGAQEHATVIARRGALVHSGCGCYEGIGCGSTPDQARRNCCFYGQRPIADEGVAYSPARRQWFAVIRYR